MHSKDAFSACHPAVNFFYYALVIGFGMCLMHPVCLAISLLGGGAYYLYLRGRRAAGGLLRMALPLFLLTALINPAFNHQGSTILRYLPTGNPLTLESILYGLAAAAMLVAVLLWFGCYTQTMTSDKFVYLFGRVLPALSLVLSMALRFVPRFKAQLEQVKEAQAALGWGTENGSLLSRLRAALRCFSVLVTWSLESAIETADSMKSRGYGLGGRTAFSIYRFTARDRALLLWLGCCGGFLLWGCLSGGLFWRYFPSLRGLLAAPRTVCLCLCYAALTLTPLALDLWEERKWTLSRSTI